MGLSEFLNAILFPGFKICFTCLRLYNGSCLFPSRLIYWCRVVSVEHCSASGFSDHGLDQL